MRSAALWARWKRVARRAAEWQGQALFFLLYFVMVMPIGFFRFRVKARGRTAGAPPQWSQYDVASTDIEAARRQG